MSAGLSDRSSAGRQEIERRLLARRTGQPRLQIPVHDRATPPPLSFGQERMWLFARLNPDTTAGSFAFSYRLDGDLDKQALRRALETIHARHEVLRTVVSEQGQVIGDPGPVELPERDFTGDSGAADAFAREVAALPYELDRLPPVRWYLLRRGQAQHELIMCLHHIASDGWSEAVLDRELAALYRAYHDGQENPLPQLPVQYADYAAWQRRQPGADTELDWWQGQLAGAPATLTLPADHQASAASSFEGSHLARSFPPPVADRLIALCAQEDATPFMVLLAGFAALLARLSGQDDIVIGAPAAGRLVPELEQLVGLFINTIAIRIDTSGDPDLRTLLRRVRTATLASYLHQAVPLEQVIERCAPAREAGRQPLVQVMFQVHNVPEYRLELPDLTVTRTQLLSSGGSALDLTLSVAEHRDASGLRALWEYRTALFEPATVQRMHDCLVRLLEQAVADPAAPLASLPLLTAEQQSAALDRPKAPDGPSPSVRRMFEERALAARDQPAIIAPGRSVSYAELSDAADQLAGRLTGAGVRPDDLVGICLERSPELITAVLAVLKAGAAYLPLEPSHPPDRLAAMIADARPKLVITSAASAPAISGVAVPRIAVADQVDGAEVSGRPADPGVIARPQDGDLAYVLYTSGSTGEPKGVAVPQRALGNYLRRARDAYDPDGRLDWILHSPLGFDLTVTSLFLPLLAGRTVTLVPGEDLVAGLAQILTGPERDPYAVKLTPAHLAALRLRLPAGTQIASAALFVIGGEQLPADEIRAWRQLAPNARFVNEYGPTEATVGCISYEVGPEPLERVAVPIGRVMPGSGAYVLDKHLHPVPAGVPGELYLGGRGIARGYLHHPSLTAERFLPDPFSGEAGAVMYQTGDLVRRSADGLFEFIGRVDRQVKIRGYRVEPAEVEAAVLAHPQIVQAVVTTRQDGQGGLALACYLRAASGASPTPAELKAWLSASLPAHLIPAAFVLLDELPLTANGKLDLARLPAPDREAAGSDAGYAAPATPAEQAIAEIWRNALDIGRIGTGDDFFMLGGHSVLASSVAAQVADALGTDSASALRALFRAPTVTGMAAALDGQPAGQGAGHSAGQPAGPPRRDDPLPLTESQEGIWFIDALAPLSCEYLVPMAWWLDGPLDLGALGTALTMVAERHEVLRMTFAEAGGRPLARLLGSDAVKLATRDLADVETDAEELLLAEATTPLDLTAGPPLRATIGRATADRHLLCLTVHHLVFDGWSQAVLLSDLADAYQAALDRSSPRWRPLAYGYPDYAAWQREPGRQIERQDRLEHVVRGLSGLTPLSLPTDRPRPLRRRGHGDTTTFTIDRAVVATIDALGRRHGATPLMVLAAALLAFLHRWTGAADITLGTSASDRFDLATRNLIGLFVNVLALRADLSDGPAFGTLLDRVRAAALDAYACQDVPFPQVVERLGGSPDLSRTPVFQVAVDYESDVAAEPSLGSVRMTPCPIPTTIAKFDLALTFRREGQQPDSDRLTGELEYDTDLFDTETARRIADAFAVTLADAVSRPDTQLSGLVAAVSGLGRQWPADADPASARITPKISFEPPGTDTERTVARIWEEVLDVQGLGQKDGFFEHGGRSLLAVQAVSLMRKAFGTSLPLDLLFKHPTVASAAAEVERIVVAEIDDLSEEAVAELLGAADGGRKQ